MAAVWAAGREPRPTVGPAPVELPALVRWVQRLARGRAGARGL